MALVNVIDSIVITEDSNASNVYAQWSVLDPSITVYGGLTSGRAVKLYLNWSDKNGTIPLHTGDYFTFLVPEVFRQDNIDDVTDAPITNPSGDVIATYSIYGDNQKEVKITFTDFVETHTDVSGNFWLLLFVGSVDTTETATIDFVINGELEASGNVTVSPAPSSDNKPQIDKVGHSALPDIYDGYYVFNWVVYFNMDEDPVNGFHIVDNFSFEDTIPEDSPHIFLTNEIRQSLGFIPTKFPLRVGEYMLANSLAVGDRYPFFRYQYNGTGANRWYLKYELMTDGYTTVGIDGAGGLNVSDVVINEKSLSAKLGRLTRPTGIQYCTMATIKISERALGDAEVVKLFTNTFKASSGEEITKSLIAYRFSSGGQGLEGNYSFSFTKVNEKGAALPGAVFSLYTEENYEDGAKAADRFVQSDANGVVRFDDLPAGTFYIQETGTPYGYIPDGTFYKVELSSEGYEIYYGDNFQHKLSHSDYKIENQPEFEVQPALVTLRGTKNLTGRTLLDDMFSFVVKDSEGKTVATGANNADGVITFSEIELDTPGVYTLTVEEAGSSYSGIAYDGNQFTVTITVADDGEGNLSADEAYPDGEIVFNNSYAAGTATVTLTGTKNLTGKDLEDGMFSFVVKDSGGATVAIGTNAADGSVTFSEIEFDEEGDYTYTVEEETGSLGGITYDENKFTVTVTITDDGEGNLSADEAYPDGEIVFNNSYAAGIATVTLTGTKNLTGKDLEDGMFSFVVKDSGGATVAIGTNAADGSITFSEIIIDSPGVYVFTVEEIKGSLSGITYDGTKYTVTVTVEDDGDGNLTAQTTYEDDEIVFTNSYSAKPPVKPCNCYASMTKCRKSIVGKKMWVDNDNAGDTRPASVEIILLRDGEVYKSLEVDSNGDGTFVFCCVPIGKNPRHKYDYQIDEVNVPDGYTKTIEGYNVINTLNP